MGVAFEAYVTDNDILGAILRSTAPVEISDETLSPDMIADTIWGAIEEWQAAGRPNIETRARAMAADILATHYPSYLPTKVDDMLRRNSR